MNLPNYTPPSTWPDDEHAFCPCGLVMSRDNTGTLVCEGCRVVAEDAASEQQVRR
jgi:hypothetical protein